MKKVYILLFFIGLFIGCGDISDKKGVGDILEFLDKTPSIPKGGIVLVSPTGGEVSITPIKVRWAADTSVIKFVNIYLYNDITDIWKKVGSYIPAKMKAFEISDVPTQNCRIRIRITSSTNDSISVTSNFMNFKYNQPTLLITAPRPGDVVYSEQNIWINWQFNNTSNLSSSFNLFYSFDRTNWILISNTYTISYSYNWSVPRVTEPKDCYLRIVHADNPGISYTMSSPFKIMVQPVYTITNPTAGTELKAGNNYLINWNSTKTTTVNIHYSLDSTNWITIVTNKSSYIGSSNSYYWTVPLNITTRTKAFIRIQNALNPGEFGISPRFYINPIQKIKIIKPTASDILFAGKNFNIEWEKGDASWVKIEYSSVNSNTWSTIYNGHSGTSYSWTVPQTITSGDYRIRITDYNGVIPGDTSQNFKILANSVKFMSPYNGASIKANSDFNIQWQAKDINYLNCDFSSDNGTTWTKVFENQVAVANGSYTWKVPDVNSTTCKLKIYDKENPAINDEISISIYKPELTFISPTASAIWIGGTQRTIQWSSKYLQRVNLEYSTNGGSTWNTIVTYFSTQDGTNSYSWTVPTLTQTYPNCKIRIVDYNDNKTFFVSPTFTIQKP